MNLNEWRMMKIFDVSYRSTKNEMASAGISDEEETFVGMGINFF